MKKFALYLFLIMAGYSYSQDFTTAAEQEQQLDEYGNVINNVTDKQGKKQGDWFYLDVNGSQLVKKEFLNDNCQATYFFINNKWQNINSLSTSTENNPAAIRKLKAQGIELNKNRQILIILNESGEFLSGNLLGNWAKDDETKVVSILKSHLSELNIKSSGKMYILL